jgi:exosortase A-associated hydrolase 1
MTVREQAVSISVPGADLLGIISRPPPGRPERRTAVVIVVGGAQYRAGSHRQFALLARHLAGAGYPVLRFDWPGMGDSTGEPVPFEDTSPLVASVVEKMCAVIPTAERIVLWGLCDGASASLLYVEGNTDSRIAGLALLNPWVRSELGLAQAQVKHYYPTRLRDPAFWRKVLAGGVGWQSLQSLAKDLRVMLVAASGPPGFQERMAKGWQRFDGPILLILSEADLTAQEFIEHALRDPRWAKSLEKPHLQHLTIPGADHTFSSPEAHVEVNALTLDWLSTHCGESASGQTDGAIPNP